MSIYIWVTFIPGSILSSLREQNCKSRNLFHGCIQKKQNSVFFPYFPKYSILVVDISQHVKKLQHGSLYEVIEDIIPFVLNTKRPLSYIWLLSYEKNSFGCFLKKFTLSIFPKTPKTVLLISQQPNIAQRPFCIKNERQDVLYHLK